jgi:hypothetical protein
MIIEFVRPTITDRSCKAGGRIANRCVESNDSQAIVLLKAPQRA